MFIGVWLQSGDSEEERRAHSCYRTLKACCMDSLGDRTNICMLAAFSSWCCVCEFVRYRCCPMFVFFSFRQCTFYSLLCGHSLDQQIMFSLTRFILKLSLIGEGSPTHQGMVNNERTRFQPMFVGWSQSVSLLVTVTQKSEIANAPMQAIFLTTTKGSLSSSQTSRIATPKSAPFQIEAKTYSPLQRPYSIPLTLHYSPNSATSHPQTLIPALSPSPSYSLYRHLCHNRSHVKGEEVGVNFFYLL